MICDVALKTSYAAKPSRIVFDKVGYIRKYDVTKYLVVFYSDEKYKRTFHRIRYLVMLKSNISDVCSHKYMKIKVN